jgi:hypothetical protein
VVTSYAKTVIMTASYAKRKGSDGAGAAEAGIADRGALKTLLRC